MEFPNADQSRRCCRDGSRLFNKMAIVWSSFWLTASVCIAAQTGVSRVEILARDDVAEGRSFGSVGPYERLIGTIFFEADPQDTRNGGIVDIRKAPVNERGLVEFSADFWVLKPKDTAKGNRAILFDVANRGRSITLDIFNRAHTRDVTTNSDVGDGFLLDHGFTIVSVGWQCDVPQHWAGVRLVAPTIGNEIKGRVKYEFSVAKPVQEKSLVEVALANPYLPSDLQSMHDVLTVRSAGSETYRKIPRNAWHFDGFEDPNAIPVIRTDNGFETGVVYELVYESSDPPVAGLGFLAVRDSISHLRRTGKLVGDIKYVYAFGRSQTGRFLRDFLYIGFNVDIDGRQVFDGVMAHVAGAARGSFNDHFAQPSLDHQAEFPFSDTVQTDPQNGAVEGLLEQRYQSGGLPKIFYTNSSAEYWRDDRLASLTHVSVDGLHDLKQMENVRTYLFASTQHFPSPFPPRARDNRSTVLPQNPNNYRWILRALLLAMDRWVRDGKQPPPSAYPRLSDGSLVSPTNLNFPKLPAVPDPSLGMAPRGTWPPQLVPQTDRDGNEIAGVRLPAIAVPLATYTGWNYRNSAPGLPPSRTKSSGSFISFKRTPEQGVEAGAPRPSIADRYSSRNEYERLVNDAASQLSDAGFILHQDIPKIFEEATELWDYVMNVDQPSQPHQRTKTISPR